MRVARTQADLVLTPEAALRLWTDVDRWPSFVEGFARPVDRSPEWPHAGARLVWESSPAGRGRVTEKVMEAEGPDRFVTQVFEERLHGVQTFRVVSNRIVAASIRSVIAIATVVSTSFARTDPCRPAMRVKMIGAVVSKRSMLTFVAVFVDASK